jgi:hypothetical protein
MPHGNDKTMYSDDVEVYEFWVELYLYGLTGQ